MVGEDSGSPGDHFRDGCSEGDDDQALLSGVDRKPMGSEGGEGGVSGMSTIRRVGGRVDKRALTCKESVVAEVNLTACFH